MNRRELALASLALTAGLQPLAAVAQGRKPVDGQEYLTLDKPVNVDAPKGKIDFIEFFSYGCPHCAHFEPTFAKWLKDVPKDVVVRRVPVGFQPAWVPFQNLYYVLEALGKIDELHGKVFQSVHGERSMAPTVDSMADWAARNGIPKPKFLEYYNSFSLQSKVKRATQTHELFRISGVPSFGVAGRFYIDGELAKSMERALEVCDYLMGEVRRGR